MPFLFSFICDLLQDLDDVRRKIHFNSPSGPEIVRKWSRQHRPRFDEDPSIYPALLSTLLPEKRSDRVYNIREKKLQSLIFASLLLGPRRQKEFAKWSEPGSGVDLADSVERSLRETRNPRNLLGPAVTIEEIDDIFQDLASTCRWSSPAIRSSSPRSREDLERELSCIYNRLSPRDAKWFTRLVLKDYSPVLVDHYAVYSSCHPQLPAVLRVRDDFSVACSFLQRHGGSDPRSPRRLDRKALYLELKPVIGTKVGRQTWVEGRSIKQCLQICQGRGMSCEDKIDGEYCQIHIDVEKGTLQIFSKSGKNSTQDREGLHDAIRNSLRLGKPDCRLKKNCILEGELVVYSDREKKVLDFYKIKNYVSRRGTFIGLGQGDIEQHPWEHLMVIYYDVLMIDDESLLGVRQSQRFERLRRIITCVEGHSELVQRDVISSGRTAASDLIHAFARCIAAGKEGLVLKPDDSYFNFGSSNRPYSSCVVKLKKEYLGGFGDVGDFAVVGARYDAAKAKTYGISGLKWTHFYIGCLKNKEEVLRWDWKPEFKVTNVVELNATQLKAFMTSVYPQQVAPADNDHIVLDIGPNFDEARKPSTIFANPPVFDIRCFSFDKEKAAKFWTPRFPMVNKIHADRTYRDVLTFAELQDMALAEKENNVPQDSQQIKDLMTTLGGDQEESQVWTQSTVSSGGFASAVSEALSQSHGLYDGKTIDRPIDLTLLKDSQEHRQVKALEADGPPTLPRSSAASAPQEDPVDEPDPSQKIESNRKRCRSPAKSERSLKARRRSPDQTDSPSATPPSSIPSRSDNQRAPLTDVASSSLRRNRTHAGVTPRVPGVTSMHIPSSDKEAHPPSSLTRLPSSLSASSLDRLRRPISPPKPSLRKSTSAPGTAFSTPVSSPGTCKYCPSNCDLSSYSFLVLPCITTHSRLAEKLLAEHGVTHFITDPADWATNASTPSSREGTPTPSDKPTRHKKIAIVDKDRREATEVFLKSIDKVNLVRRNGMRDFVRVYDWRVLEDLSAKEDRCKRYGEKRDDSFDISSGKSPWSRHWLGLV